MQFDLVFLDHRIGEQLLAHLLDAGARLALVLLVELEFDQFALADVADGAEAQIVEGMADRFALRIEHTVFQGHKDTRFHQKSLFLPAQANMQDTLLLPSVAASRICRASTRREANSLAPASARRTRFASLHQHRPFG